MPERVEIAMPGPMTACTGATLRYIFHGASAFADRYWEPYQPALTFRAASFNQDLSIFGRA